MFNIPAEQEIKQYVLEKSHLEFGCVFSLQELESA